MDEYFMDASFLLAKEELQIRTFAQKLQRDIVETTGLYGSIGIARSKTYAKLASGLNKPQGFLVLVMKMNEYIYTHYHLKKFGGRPQTL